MGRSLVEKLWERHRAADLGDGTDLLYIDRVLLHVAAQGAGGGAGYAIEFAGGAVAALSVEARMTLCNMAVEFAAWTGLVVPTARIHRKGAGRW